MNGASATAFLPIFVRFPSPRGLNSSTVQPGSEPLLPNAPPVHCAPPTHPTHPALPQRRSARREMAPAGASWCRTVRMRAPGGPAAPCQLPPPVVPDGPDAGPRRTSCPVSAASAAASSPAAPAGRPASAGRAAAARTPRRAAGRAAAPASGRPPAARAAAPGVAARTRTRPPGVRPRGGHDADDEHDADCRQDDAHNHDVTLLSFPRSDPPWAIASRLCFLCEGGMPPPGEGQSRVEELQRLRAGWPP